VTYTKKTQNMWQTRMWAGESWAACRAPADLRWGGRRLSTATAVPLQLAQCEHLNKTSSREH